MQDVPVGTIEEAIVTLRLRHQEYFLSFDRQFLWAINNKWKEIGTPGVSTKVTFPINSLFNEENERLRPLSHRWFLKNHGSVERSLSFSLGWRSDCIRSHDQLIAASCVSSFLLMAAIIMGSYRPSFMDLLSTRRIPHDLELIKNMPDVCFLSIVGQKYSWC